MFLKFRLMILFLIGTSWSMKAFAGCDGEEITYLKGSDFSVQGQVFNPSSESSSLILIMPPTGGVNFIDRSYGRFFCNKGLRALIVTGWTGDNEVSFDLGIHRKFYRKAQSAMDIVLEQNEEFQIGILGTSVGALHSAISLARNESVKAAFLIVGGGDIATIIANSDQKVLVDAKRVRFKKLGFRNNQEYVHALRNVVPYEPTSISFSRKRRRIGMSISTRDTTVPTSNQEILRAFWKPEVEMFSNFGHVGTVLKTWLFNQEDIGHFFAKSLAKNPLRK